MSPSPGVPGGPALWLASGSAARAAMLRRAGIEVSIEAAMIDESEVKHALKAERADAAAAAETLAELKAMRVARRHAGALVIGADQMLVCEGAWFDKPESVDAARAQLRALRGRKHELISAVCVVRDTTRLWHHREVASLWMRTFSDAFLERYVAETAEDCTSTVGAYRVEGLGIQLFQRIEGDHSTILGLPMLPLLDFLRNHGAVTT